MKYSIPFDDIPTGAVADGYKTIAAIVVPNTAGARVRLTAVEVGPADDTPADRNLAVKIARVAAITSGTPGTAGTTIAAGSVPKKETRSRDSLCSGKLNYSAEPTTYETYPVFQLAVNDRGLFVKEFGDDGPVFELDQLCGLLAAPRAAAASRVSGTLEFEEF